MDVPADEAKPPPSRVLTFIHRSPFATWNPLQAWIRWSHAAPAEVVIMHLASMGRHAGLVAEGVRSMVVHYGGDASKVRTVAVASNTLPVWRDAIRGLLDQEGRWVVDVTPARTIAKLAVTAALRAPEEHDILYLDVAGYRYEAKPFSWVPYTSQTIRMLAREGKKGHRNVQRLGPSPGAPPLSRSTGLARVGKTHVEIGRSWDALVVLLNEAGASAGDASDDRAGVFDIKLPALGLTLGSYDLESRRLRLEPLESIERHLAETAGNLDGLWRREIPSGTAVLEALAAARLLRFQDQDLHERLLHDIAALTRGPESGAPLPWVGLDTNLFYFEFFTTLVHAAKVPLVQIPLVASSVSLSEITHQMGARFPPRADPPRVVKDSEVFRPLAARLAHAAHEEFHLLRTRCRMAIVHGATASADNTANDSAILDDLASFARNEDQPVIVLSNDRGFVEQGEHRRRLLDVRRVRYGAFDKDLASHADVDQVAYLVYRLSLAFGRVGLKGLGVEVFGDHPDEEKRSYIHAKVRIRMPDRPWVAGFLHELALRPKLDTIVHGAGLWL